MEVGFALKADHSSPSVEHGIEQTGLAPFQSFKSQASTVPGVGGAKLYPNSLPPRMDNSSLPAYIFLAFKCWQLVREIYSS